MICGKPPGCSVNVCLDARSCDGTIRPEGVEPVKDPSSTPVTSPAASRPSAPTATVSVAPGPLDGYDFDVASYGYWFNANNYDSDYYIKINGILTVNTRCVTVLESSEGATFSDASEIPKNTEIMWSPHPAGEYQHPDTCCIAYYSNDQCQESGHWASSCEGFTKHSTFNIRSWKVYNCHGRYERV